MHYFSPARESPGRANGPNRSIRAAASQAFLLGKHPMSDNGQKPRRRRRTVRARRTYPDLASWRAALGLSGSSAADVLGISQTQYSRLERGLYAIKGPKAKRLMIITGVPLEKLVGVA
jgi:Helix-turn-helix